MYHNLDPEDAANRIINVALEYIPDDVREAAEQELEQEKTNILFDQIVLPKYGID